MNKKRQNPNINYFEVKEENELLPFLLRVMDKRSRNSVKSILTRGQVYVNSNNVTKHNHQLKKGDLVEIQKNKAAKAADFSNMNILYEDEEIIVIEKGAGLLSIASNKEKSLTAYKQLTDYVKKLHPKNRVFIVHRLDQDTSGVMLFAKTEKVKNELQNNWKKIVKERKYVALVEGALQQTKGTIKSWLKENKVFKMYSSQNPNDGKLAITHYELIKSNQEFSLLSVQLETGRKNQIRAHMEELGHPIVGDKKYGSSVNPIGRLGLHANILAFMHPVTNELLRFESEVPKAFFNFR
ncbi:tRNA pseudouridine32 synthase / 23S rRNA pseudouridine746 synthase [Gracilibacillus ureilyticus]|uniref:Pseudouridine synthase n=1 Tax=Gracilibacillus ureilyticus TaxID=531814 RepID=A0A1H9PU26_9BACI|nr:RluA family pseudouridine synthase [Gracilibacillus ureilyticus]SER51717.1 tRNA pseudouridine32 synthase / 23S rRNA pseudouridine746 synthase [Gracilibacillus ureilyticus]